MSPHLTKLSRHNLRKGHLAIGGILAAAVLLVAFRLVPGWASATSVAMPFGVAIAVHAGVVLAGSGLFIAALRARSRPRQADGDGLGTTLHSARLYDWMATAYTLGRESRLRERTLDVAGITANQHVLDVGCGTGTLSLAAKKRVGPNGSVRGVDASPEMIGRASAKAVRRGLAVTFEVAAAQSLPFADGAFDLVLCSLAFHHLPREARAFALAEMRRVLKPGGRALVVEFRRERGISAMLNPVALIHSRRNPRILGEVEDLVRRSGFQNVSTGPLGFGGMGYVLAER